MFARNKSCFDASIAILAHIDEVVGYCGEIVSRYPSYLFSQTSRLAYMIINPSERSWLGEAFDGDDVNEVFYTILCQLTLPDGPNFAFAGSYELGRYGGCLGCFITRSKYPSFVLTTDVTFEPYNYAEIGSIWVDKGRFTAHFPYERYGVPSGWKVARLLKKIPNNW